MISRVMPLSLALVLLATTCNIRLGVRQALEPPASSDCLAAAIASSPDVESIAERRQGRFGVYFRDSTVKNGKRGGSIFASAPDSAHAVTVNFFWDGVQHPAVAEERTVTALAGRVLRHLTAACAPLSTSIVECTYSSGRRPQSCV